VTQRAYKYRFYPTGEQERAFRRTFGATRKVWNRGLGLRSEAWRERQERVSSYDLIKMLPALKKELPYLGEVSAVALQQALLNQDKAFKNFFDGCKGLRPRVGYPRFKTRNSRKSFRLVGTALKFEAGRVSVVGFKDAPLNVTWSRPLPAGVKPSSATISLDASGRWHISLLCDETVDELPVAEPARAIGIDLGLKTFAVLSDGTEIAHPKLLAKKAARLARYQRQMSRRQGARKGETQSNRYKKAKLRVARQHAKVTDARRDFLHKASTDIVRRYDTIAIEDLAVKNMVKNRRLAKSISDSGWAEFRTQLEYKTDWYGKRLVVIDRFAPTSKTCSECGEKSTKLALTDREWVCAGCGTLHDRDLNAARNILAAGLAVAARGEDVRPKRKPRASALGGRLSSLKREPAEVTAA